MKRNYLYAILFSLISLFSTNLFSQGSEMENSLENYEKFKKDLPLATSLLKLGLSMETAIPLITAAEILVKHPFAITSISDSLNPKKILDKAIRYARRDQDKELEVLINKVEANYNKALATIKAEQEKGISKESNLNKFYYERFVLNDGKKHTVEKEFLALTKAEIRVMTTQPEASLEIKIFLDGEEVTEVQAINACSETGVSWTPPKKQLYKIVIKNTGTESVECFMYTN